MARVKGRDTPGSLTLQDLSSSHARPVEGDALSQLISLLEAQLPANPASPKGAKAEQAMERIWRRYFRTLGKSFPYEELETLYYRYVTPE